MVRTVNGATHEGTHEPNRQTATPLGQHDLGMSVQLHERPTRRRPQAM
jgi:hypothetical protein